MLRRAPWDEGLAWHTNQITPPLEQPLTVAVVRDTHLRVTNGTIEDDYITRLIRTTTQVAERVTRRALMPQTRELVLSRFPVGAGRIEVPWPPLIEVVSIDYVDPDGTPQTLTVSPPQYQVSAPFGPTCGKGVLVPARGETWPSTDVETPDAVTVTFRCGYIDGGSPEQAAPPEDIVHAQLLMIGEMYKQRSESVIGFGISVNPAVIRARDLWREYRVS
jgi:uncharacterized phiE125 gp8 family phage protein